jgi:hypothetical protein
MVAPIFKFRNIKVRLSTDTPTFVYGLNEFNPAFPGTLEDEIDPSEISTVLLSVQVSNQTGVSGFPEPAQTVRVSAWVQRSGTLSYNENLARSLVAEYPLVSNNSFDPLGGNLVLSWDELQGGDQLWLQTDVANSCDVIVSLLEIANATAN